MALILAIEPDRRQAAKVAASVRGRLDADLVLDASADAALPRLNGRVPDLVLTTALLSPKDDAALAGWLRELGAGVAWVQTLTIPVLASSSPHKKKRGGVLAAFRRSHDEDPAEGCDPAVFADQVADYLHRAATEREEMAELLELEDDEDLEGDEREAATLPPAPEPVAASPEPIIASPEPAPVPAPAPVYAPIFGSRLVGDPVPVVEAAPALEPARVPEPAPAFEPTLAAEPAAAFEPTLATERAAAFEPTLVVEPAPAFEPTPVAEPEPAYEPRLVAEAAPPMEPVPAYEPRLAAELAAALEASPAAPPAPPAPVEPIELLHPELFVAVEPAEAQAPPEPMAAATAPDLRERREPRDLREPREPREPQVPEWVGILESLRRDVEMLRAAEAPRMPLEPLPPIVVPRRSPIVVTPAAARAAVPAVPVPPPAPAPVPAPVRASAPVVQAAAPQEPPQHALKPKRRRRIPKGPAQDEWGLFDPEQCGFAALLAKLKETTRAGNETEELRST